MSDPLPRLQCDCGWPRPLIGVTRADGRLPTETLSVSYDCPQCGRVYVCGEVTSRAQESTRARAIAEASTRLTSRKLS